MGKEHPLNIFRQLDSGFDKASRKRRTVQGKVVASAPRASGRAPAVAAARAKTRRAPKLAGRPRANRMLLYSVLVVVGGFAIYLAGANASGVVPLKSTEEVFTTSTAEGGFTILAASYEGTPESRALAVAVRDVLRGQGFSEVQVYGYPPIKDDVHASYNVMVGRAASATELKQLLARLRAVPGPLGNPVPFRDARVIEAPSGS
ncbi:MAG: hypothetical protein ACYTG2_16420 [Planctomycetota bacterium]